MYDQRDLALVAPLAVFFGLVTLLGLESEVPGAVVGASLALVGGHVLPMFGGVELLWGQRLLLTSAGGWIGVAIGSWTGTALVNDPFGSNVTDALLFGSLAGSSHTLVEAGVRWWGWRSVRASGGYFLALVALGLVMVPVGTRCGKEGAYTAAMKSDLRNLVTAQESFYADHERYATDLDELAYSTSQGVSVTLIAAESAGWRGEATHRSVPKRCTMWVGEGGKENRQMEGEPECS